MTRKLTLPFIVLLLSLLCIPRPGQAYPIAIGALWTSDFTAAVRAYWIPGSTLPTVQLVNVTGPNWKANHSISLRPPLPPGISLTTSIDASLNLYSELITYVDYYQSTGSGYGTPVEMVATIDSAQWTSGASTVGFTFALPVNLTSSQVAGPSILLTSAAILAPIYSTATNPSALLVTNPITNASAWELPVTNGTMFISQ
jgi:hypothetical protein